MKVEFKKVKLKDAIKLKTYKIKNHCSGKTYNVKAKSFNDAKDKYNKMIVNDEITNIVKQVKSKFDVSATFKSDKNSQTLEITEWKENDTAKLKQYINQQLSNIDNFDKKGTNENDSLVWSWKKENVKDSLAEDDNTFMKAEIDELSRYVRNWDFMSKQERNNVMPGYSKSEGLTALKIKLAKAEASLKKDSLTEDALSKFVQSYLSSKKPKTKAEQDEIINFLLERNKITKEDIPKVRTLLKIVKDSHALKTYKIKNNDSGKTYKVKAKSFNDAKDKYNKFISIDSFNIDTEKYRGFKLYKNGTDWEVESSDGTQWNYDGSMSLQEVKKAIDKGLRTGNWEDSITKDADIAQNDIKSSYLPEDANAENIKYLGFNELRKISFYQYGDNFYAHYDLTGAVEKIDKDAVQRILKKNIIGEIDEDILTQKQSKNEEIVKDSDYERYTLKTGRRSDAFKQYLRDRGLKFEPSQNGNYTEFVVFNADESVDRRVNEIIKTISDAFEDARDFKSGDIVHLKGYPANAELELVSRNSKGAWEAKPIPGSSLQKTYYLMSEYFDSTVADKLIGNGEVHFRYKGGRVITGAWNKNKLNEREISSILNKYNCKREQERWNDIVFSTRIGNEENLCKAFNEINPSYSVSELLSFHDSKERGDK